MYADKVKRIGIYTKQYYLQHQDSLRRKSDKALNGAVIT